MGIYAYRILVTSISRSRRRCTLGVKVTGDMILPLSVVYVCMLIDVVTTHVLIVCYRRRYNTDTHLPEF